MQDASENSIVSLRNLQVTGRVFLVVFCAVWGLNHINIHTTGIPVVWPLNGIILGFMLLSRGSVAGAYGLGHILGHFFGYKTEIGWEPSLVMATTNGLELLLSYFLLYQVFRENVGNLGHPRVLWRFTVWAVFFAPAVTGVVAGWFLKDFFLAETFEHTWFLWWSGNALGMALFGPVVATLHPANVREWYKHEELGSMVIRVLVLLVVTIVVFYESNYPLLFFSVPCCHLGRVQNGVHGIAYCGFYFIVSGSSSGLCGGGSF